MGFEKVNSCTPTKKFSKFILYKPKDEYYSNIAGENSTLNDSNSVFCNNIYVELYATIFTYTFYINCSVNAFDLTFNE